MLRRGQVTMFVILGLALLLIVGVVILREPSREPPSLAAQQDAARATAVQRSIPHDFPGGAPALIFGSMTQNRLISAVFSRAHANSAGVRTISPG